MSSVLVDVDFFCSRPPALLSLSERDGTELHQSVDRPFVKG